MRIPNVLTSSILLLALSPLWAEPKADASFEPETATLVLILTIGFDQDQPTLTLTLMTCASPESPCLILFTITVSSSLIDIAFPIEAFDLDDESEFLDEYQPFSVEDEPVSENPDGGP